MGAIKLEWLDIRDLTERDAALCADRLPQRFERSQAFLHEANRLRCLGAGLLMLRLGLRDEADIVYGTHGKPSVAYLPPFNVSHSGNYVVCAVGESSQGETSLGVDVERLGACFIDVAKRVYVDEELDWMQQKSVDQRFYTLWTCKEAVMKLFGEGLYMEPKSFNVMPLIRGESLTVNGVEIHARFEMFDDHTVCAVSTTTEIEDATTVR